MKLGLETETLHLLFQHKKMDIFDFIEYTYRMGLDGVQINIIEDYNLHKELGTLNSFDEIYLRRVRDFIKSKDLYCEIDTRGTGKYDFEKAIKIARTLDADIIRTYIMPKDFNPSNFSNVIENIKNIVPLLKKYRIKLALENHEYETSNNLLEIVKAIDSIWVGVLFDIGNSMMVYEEPLVALKNLAPYIFSVHFKDNIVTQDSGRNIICGVPIGDGSCCTEKIFDYLVENTSVTRINIETCYPYCATFKREMPKEFIFENTFEIKEPPFDLSLISPMDYYYPHKISSEATDILIEAQLQGVKKSVEIMRSFVNKYCR